MKKSIVALACSILILAGCGQKMTVAPRELADMEEGFEAHRAYSCMEWRSLIEKFEATHKLSPETTRAAFHRKCSGTFSDTDF